MWYHDRIATVHTDIAHLQTLRDDHATPPDARERFDHDITRLTGQLNALHASIPALHTATMKIAYKTQSYLRADFAHDRHARASARFYRAAILVVVVLFAVYLLTLSTLWLLEATAFVGVVALVVAAVLAHRQMRLARVTVQAKRECLAAQDELDTILDRIDAGEAVDGESAS